MDQLLDLVEGVQLEPIALLDILLTAILLYGLFSLIQGTRAVRLIVGAILLYVLYVVAQALDLRLLSGIMQIGAVVGLFALVVVFQPELRRGLDRLGRVGSLRWLGTAAPASHERAATIIAGSAAALSQRRTGALIVIERDTGLGDMAESGVRVEAHLTTELLTSLFTPGAALHDGAVIVRGDVIVAAGVMLPLAENVPQRERVGTRHRAALGVTEQTDALAVVVSEESGAMSLAEDGGLQRVLDEDDLRQRLGALVRPAEVSARARGMAERGGRTLRGKRVRGAAQRGRLAGPTATPAPVSASAGQPPAPLTASAAAGPEAAAGGPAEGSGSAPRISGGAE
jgi:diadenylate cyclase